MSPEVPGRLGKEEARMQVRVTAVFVPAGSTIGLGRGVPEGDETKLVEFAGDWRAMAAMALAAAAAEDDGERGPEFARPAGECSTRGGELVFETRERIKQFRILDFGFRSVDQ